jgi:hypothetical protein
MVKLFQKIGHELREVLVPTLFFFFMFHLVALTNLLMLESYQVSATRAVLATIGALVGGKAVLVANHLSFVNRFDHKPLIWGVLWKSMIYAFFCALFLILEQIVVGVSHQGGILRTGETLLSHVSIPKACANAIWLFIALLLYNSFTELDRYLGKGSIRRVFFVSRSPR